MYGVASMVRLTPIGNFLRDHSQSVLDEVNDVVFTAITSRTDAYKFSFSLRTVREWNSLAPHSRLKLIPTHSY